MEPNEVMENEEVIETATEEIVKASSGCGFKVAAGFGLGILAGMAICKLARPVIAKIKARKAAPIIDVGRVPVTGCFPFFRFLEEGLQ